MIHEYTKTGSSGDHWSVGSHASKPLVLVQLQEGDDQVRLELSPEQAEALAEKLRSHAVRARGLDSNRNATPAVRSS